MDNKTKFFRSVILLQFILVFLLGIFILFNLQHQKILKIRYLHPYEFTYGFVLPMLFFGVSLVVSTWYLFSKKEYSIENEIDILKAKRLQNFWKFAFYWNVFIVIFIAIVSAGVFRQDPCVIDQPILFYILIYVRCLIVLIVSMVMASLFLSSGIYWKSNKTLAAIIVIFSFFIIFMAFIFEILFIGEFMTASKGYKEYKNERRVMVNEEEKSAESAEIKTNYDRE